MKKRTFFLSLLAVLTVLAAAFPMKVLASAIAGQYVFDTAGIMSSSEVQNLQSKAKEISERYGCAVYIVTVDDYRKYNSYSPYEAAKSIYTAMDFGYGSGRDGELLFLSMDDRDYAIIAYGQYGNACFTDYGKEKLDEVYLDDFRNNDWYSGFSDYLVQSEKYLDMAAHGTFFDIDTDPEKKAEDLLFGLLISLVIAMAVSGLICFILYKKMRSAVEAGNADFYAVEGSFRVSGRQDRFLRRATTRRKIERQQRSGGGGGTHIDSGGFSGHSGKF